jgi:hypothetical protein
MPATQSVPLGTQPTLNYKITGTATGASINGAAVPDAGSNTYQPTAPTQNTQYFLTLTPGGNTCGPAQVNVTGIPGTIDTPLTALPARVPKGSTTALTWGTSHMSSCELLQNGAVADASVPLSASNFASPPVTAATTFTLSCTDGTLTKTSSASVTLIPTYQEL